MLTSLYTSSKDSKQPGGSRQRHMQADIACLLGRLLRGGHARRRRRRPGMCICCVPVRGMRAGSVPIHRLVPLRIAFVEPPEGLLSPPAVLFQGCGIRSALLPAGLRFRVNRVAGCAATGRIVEAPEGLLSPPAVLLPGCGMRSALRAALLRRSAQALVRFGMPPGLRRGERRARARVLVLRRACCGAS